MKPLVKENQQLSLKRRREQTQTATTIRRLNFHFDVALPRTTRGEVERLRTKRLRLFGGVSGRPWRTDPYIRWFRRMEGEGGPEWWGRLLTSNDEGNPYVLLGENYLESGAGCDEIYDARDTATSLERW
jgi:hypothetical protein